MNRVEFMRQLECLLQSVSATEREEAIQYYNDYFDDAGAENEQNVIEALGNPARVAENIKRDLIGNGYGEPQNRKAQASDRALIKYGEKDAESGEETESGADQGTEEGIGLSTGVGSREDMCLNAGASTGECKGLNAGISTGEGVDLNTGSSAGEGIGLKIESDIGKSVDLKTGEDSGLESGRNADTDTESGMRQNVWADTRESMEFGADNGTGSVQNWETPPRYHETEREPEPKEGMPVWAVALIATILILMSPAIFGVVVALLSVIFAFFVTWFSLIFAFGSVAVILLLVLVLLVVVGIGCSFVDPWVGMALTGGGLICGSLGLLFLMLTVAMAGIGTPAICKGISSLFRIFRKRSVKRRARRTV